MYEEQVTRGAAWLDEHIGLDWPLKIDLGVLDLSNCRACIVGQLLIAPSVSIVDSVEAFYNNLDLLGVDRAQQTELGFNIGEPGGDYRRLQGAWEKEIKRRLNKGVTLEDA